MINFPLVNIVILTWNHLKDTIECLDSINVSDYPNYRIVVVDNASTDSTVEYVKENYPQVKILQNPENLGYAEGNNVGIRYALDQKADYIFILNNDASIKPDTISRLVQHAEKNEHCGLISPIIKTIVNNRLETYQGTYIDLVSKTKKNIRNIHDLTKIQETEPEKICLWGTALFLSKRFVMEIGLLDARYFAYYEDMDLSIRSALGGYYNHIVLDATVFHHQKPDHRVDYPEHYHFYMARNEYLFWTTYIKSIQKKNFKRKYIAKMLFRAGGYKKISSCCPGWFMECA